MTHLLQQGLPSNSAIPFGGIFFQITTGFLCVALAVLESTEIHQSLPLERSWDQKYTKMAVMVQPFNPSTREAEAGGSL